MSNTADVFKAQLETLIASGVAEDEVISCMLGVALIAKVKLGLGESVKALIDKHEARLMKTLPKLLDPLMQSVGATFH
jgi:hypothetical protein